MKKFTYLLLASLFTAPAFAQTDLEQKVNQLEQRFTKLEAELHEKQEQLISYENTLHLLEAKPVVDYAGVTFRITKAEGSRSNKEVVVSGIFENTNTASRSMQVAGARYIDSEGNMSTRSDTDLGTGVRIQDLLPNAPLKFQSRIRVEETTAPKIRAFTMSMYQVDEMPKTTLVFENITIDWKD